MLSAKLIARHGRYDWHLFWQAAKGACVVTSNKKVFGENVMKIWSKPAVREQEVGLEVTSYLPAEIDVI
jgi:coenzyme PQQ precursor peptide PqqA